MSSLSVQKSTASNIDPDKRQAWWRFPIVWLVISGPLLVVIASITSAVIAIRGADPVLTRDESSHLVTPQQAADTMTPAMLARNHAATVKP